MKQYSHFCLLVLAGLALAPSSGSADTWAPPRTEVILSANGQFRVEVVPRPLGGALPYFRDKVDGIEPAGQRSGDPRTSAIARVEKREPRGAWRVLWQMPLVNDVGPTSMLLANDASFLVTFDNWHSAGFGDDVIAIYDRQGDLVRKLSLEQVLPQAYVNHLPTSVSSRWWGGEHRLVGDDRIVELRVVAPGGRTGLGRAYVPVQIRLEDGAVIPPRGAAWENALDNANKLESERLDAWAALRKLRAQPLAAPLSWDTRAWRHYLFELRDRIAVEGERMGGMVLPAPGAEPGFHDAYDISDWFREYDEAALYPSKSLVVVSPTSDKLASLLVECLMARPPGSMEKAHVVFVGTPAQGRQVIAAAVPSGARVTVVDRTGVFPPGEPLPESPEPRWRPRPARF